MTIDNAFRALARPSRNGYETTISMVGWINYNWALIRYPEDPHNKEPTTQPVVFKAIGKRDKLYWSRALAQVTEYLENHPDDGFSY